MKFRLGKNCIRLWRIRGTLAALPVCFVCGILAALFPTTGILLCIISIVIYLLYFFWYTPRLFRSGSASLQNGRLTWRSGVLFSVCISLRLETILTASISHTPLQSLLGLCTLSVRPVGAPISLRQLAEPDARALLRCIEEAADD
ncbi:PH domain-containing protein [Faecalispora anaeroviscerum]|uniref:PH domain-containing protein n=1 Tax=Faecalispora anaeroviscerum TaxID=2991836 RepID=UPI0024B99AD9|nr:PH domain-containing protein [Faecalispora anaeroviscerum]